MFPAALAIVVAAFPIGERGKALALFFGITGALTAVGPLAGGYLTEWTWRSIFWVNVPVAIIALILTTRAKPDDTSAARRRSTGGAPALIAAGMGLAVLGLQQASQWGWAARRRSAASPSGSLLLAAFVRYELRTEHPLIDVRIFRDRGFAGRQRGAVPAARWCSSRSSSSRACTPRSRSARTPRRPASTCWSSSAGSASPSQWGGRIYDAQGRARRGRCPAARSARSASTSGPQSLDDFELGDQWIYIVMAGAGLRLRPGPGEHRRAQPRREHPLRRGDRDQPDRRATSARASASRCSARS